MGELTRRSLLGSALAGGGALLAPNVTRVLAREPDGDVFTAALVPGRPLHVRKRFDLVAIEWEAPAHVHVELRARRGDGAWGPWQPASADHGHGPDRTAVRLISDPVWTGGADVLEVRSSRPLRGARAHFVAVAPERGEAGSAALRLAQPQLAAGPGQPPIIARSTWATRACRPRRPAYYGALDVAFVHHTVGANWYPRSASAAIVRSICLFHKYVHGWNDIGYNFLVDRYGRIFEGRAGGIDEPLAGAQAGGYNLLSTGVALLGTFVYARPTAAAMDAVARLLAWKLTLHGIDASGTTVVEVSPYGSAYSRYRAGSQVTLHRIAGHRDGDTTTCPGSALYRRLPALRGRVAALQGPLPALSAQVVSGATVSGVLTSAGEPVSGAAIELSQRRPGRETTIATATTAADGSWQATLQLSRNAVIRALYRGAPGISAVVAPAILVTVPPQITLEAAQQQAATGSVVLMSGTVTPAKKRVTLVVSQLQPTGAYTPVRTIRVAVAADGSFSRGVGFTAPGQYQVVAETAADTVNAAGGSPPVAITVV
jgi:hypothetical protein